MKSWKQEAVILAIGMLVMGYFIKQGLDTFSGKDRVVNVKGLAEMEVPANKVTWPLMYKDLGLSLIHISEPTRRRGISYAVFCLKKKKK